MGSYIEEPEFKTITVKPLHPTFGAEVEGVNFHHLSDGQFNEILAAMAKHGFCMFRNTGLDDANHIQFSYRIGDLDTMKTVHDRRPQTTVRALRAFRCGQHRRPRQRARPKQPASTLWKGMSPHIVTNKPLTIPQGNALFHVDSSFNPRRASFSLLRAVEIPPPGNGGNTDFADSRTAWDELDPALQQELLENDYVVHHSVAQSRKLGSPEFFKDLDPTNQGKMARHRLVQIHEPSGRRNIYIAAHSHHIEGVSKEKSDQLMKTLLEHVTQKKNTVSVEWKNPSDMIIWDNRCTLHKANGGAFEGKYRRDLRRTTVHDVSSTAWGLNEVEPDTAKWIVNHAATKSAGVTKVQG
ncbi:alpha-ketoglutarate-dependent 2,4-dichlorophenoxyacetate dioxygenase [Exophiala viscosa]|uniref:alpha-ketoglutarate-dependent 2,4-dichlorophenoxyacetate dioxygenase n=1 Tax=Exophiala viscosa TaxID=2486360 RepID=UPI0021A0D1E4|nr:alpha-ketoglutarate-dependent 2,4-dichlorophenoxyacetate dioxygenase [Exophiala viscosa]